MPRVFISYRRAETEAITGRIHEHLARAFGANRIFMDVENLRPGEDFRDRLRRAVRSSDVLLVIIGPQWATLSGRSGLRRLDDPDDPVRFEIETGLQRRGMRVIPVLVNSAPMPAPGDLPPTLRDLAYRNAAVVRNNPYFRTDIDYLIQQIKPRRRGRWKWIAALLLLVLLAGLAALAVLRGVDLPFDLGSSGSTNPPASASATPDAGAYRQQGDALLRAGQYEQAIASYDQAIALDPGQAGTYVQRGTARAAMNDCAGAVADFSQALSVDASNVEALLGRARVQQLCLNDPAAALSDTAAAASLRPDDPGIQLELARLYDQLGRTEDAVATYRRYQELAGDQADPAVAERIQALEAQPTPTPGP